MTNYTCRVIGRDPLVIMETSPHAAAATYCEAVGDWGDTLTVDVEVTLETQHVLRDGASTINARVVANGVVGICVWNGVSHE